MPADDSTLTRRYALKLALIYLLIRSIPDLVLYAAIALPDSFNSLTAGHDAWLQHIYPMMPVGLANVPLGFQLALALLPALTLETLLVFLFSAIFLRLRPGVADSDNKSRWVVLILATVIWSCVIRQQLLGYVQTLAMNELMTRQNDADFFDALPVLLMKAYWRFTSVAYVTAPVWAWLPIWLHFRRAKQPVEAIVNGTASVRATGMAVPLQRATVFASFLLGCLILHIALVEGTYMLAWPWLAELSRLTMPMDDPDGLSLPMTLNQNLAPTLMCALAAYIFVRRLLIDSTSIVRLVGKPLLAGVIAYLLTCFLFLTLGWIVVWLNPEVPGSFLQRISYDPESGIRSIIALNIGALALLCVISGRLRESPRRWSAVLVILVLFAAVPSYVGWTLARTNMGMAGGKPGAAVTGELADARWRNMEQWCTGVVETRHGTWLVGRSDRSATDAYVPDGVPDLSALASRDGRAGNPGASGWFGSRPVLTTLSLLQDDGAFKMMATIPEVGCLVVSPTSETLFLLTGLRHPTSSYRAREQSLVFRSTDHGMSWEWLESGFMSDAQPLAWSIEPTFASEQEVWAWGKRGLLYSRDQGQTSTAIDSPEPLVTPASYLREMLRAPDADFSGRPGRDQERFVVQVSDKHAYAWVSDSTWHNVDGESHQLALTTRAELVRSGPQDEWQIIHVTREPGVYIRHLITSPDRRTHAILRNEKGEWLARLDTQNGEWIGHQKTPAVLPGWLAEGDLSTRYFWSNGDYQVVSLWGYTSVPRLLFPFSEKPAEILTNAHFYTRNGGRSWHQLAIPGYLGVMGLSPHGSKLYWTKGNWYDNDEPLQWHYDLAR